MFERDACAMSSEDLMPVFVKNRNMEVGRHRMFRREGPQQDALVPDWIQRVALPEINTADEKGKSVQKTKHTVAIE